MGPMDEIEFKQAEIRGGNREEDWYPEEDWFPEDESDDEE